ncbi:tRNA (32-2'-O)-methyltransferase regulator THADA-like isoform X1 [Pleurodeles waltl]|uniref:tRNA (32-2'-O)-methyltransferase regulator THADA-like isoform X1 n=1 Tax=Pleurodeles waltl TaxID=8319 RepID=UPI0037099069
MKPPSTESRPTLAAGVMEGTHAQYRSCLLFYQDSCQGHLGAAGMCLAALAQKLCQSAGESVKRCKDRHLDEALELLQGKIPSLQAVDDGDLLPIVRCLLLMQLESASSSGTFSKLEKILSHFYKAKESLVSAEVERLMGSLVANREVLPLGDLQAVCMFMADSCAGRKYWRQNLPMLLRCVAATLEHLLLDEMASSGEWGYFSVKLCLQMFQGMQEEISTLAWTRAGNSASLQWILGSLVQVITMETVSRDTRLLAGTALSMLANAAPEPEQGATAMQNLFQYMGSDAGELEFGALNAAVSMKCSDGLDKLALTWGLVSCGRNEILICELGGAGSQVCLLVDVLLPVVIALSSETTKYHYHCFQVFSLWLQRVQENAPEIWHVRKTRLFHQNSEVMQNVTRLLWSNSEKPAEGTSEFVLRSFQLYLKTYCLECDHFGDTEKPLYKEFLLRIAAIPWQVKARYAPLCALLPFAGPDMVLEIYSELPEHILSCLTTNYLGPLASDVYKTTLQLQRKAWSVDANRPSELQLAHRWAHCWLPVLSQALTSLSLLLQRNASNYLLGQTLKLFPSSYDLLGQGFQGTDSASLRAWITLLNSVKMTTGAMPSDEQALERLSLCIHSADEAVRLSAIGLLCCSPRTNQALSETEIRLLQECLPLSLNCDSSGFRQLLQASVKKALVRLRDSCLASLRSYKGKTSKEQTKCPDGGLSLGIDFVEWLMELIIFSLRPASNFQRRKTALLLMCAVLETCTDSWCPERKKGQPPQNMADLLSFARQRGRWDFFCRTNLLALMSCLPDSTNEIRDLAAELLLGYFSLNFPESLTVSVFEHAQEAMCNPRVQEAEAGAGMMKTAMQWSDSSTLRKLFPAEKDPMVLQCTELCYARHLLGMLKDHFTIAQQDLLQAAATRPMQGVILALRQCLLEAPRVMDCLQNLELRHHWKEVIENLVTTVSDIGIFLLRVLYGKQETTIEQPAAAPSFADMGQAIRSLIQQGKGLEQPQEGNEDAEDSVLLSEEHSLILTCCWVSIKEIGLLLGSLVQKTLTAASLAGVEPLLPEVVLETVAGLFRNVLLQCRHWGAVEGCSLGFTRFCCTLLSHHDRGIRLVPRRMLVEALDLLQEHRPSSITRRAAGFPMLILGIVSAEDVAASRPLLAQCIQTSLALASRPLPTDWDETVDLPQVSAVHVLQTLVRSSNLAVALLPFVAPMVVLSLKALVSPCWAMRNAAVQLFSALTARTLGQKRSWGESCSQNAVTPQAFFSQHPELRAVLLKELLGALDSSMSSSRGRVRLCHSLHPTLTLLSHLQPGNEDLDSSSSCFVEPLVQLAGNPIFAVRVMAAQALVPAVPVAGYSTLLLRLVRELPSEAGDTAHNALHGRLLQIQALLTQALAQNSLLADALLSLAHGLESCFWLLTPAQRCPLIRTAYLCVISLLNSVLSSAFRQRVEESLSAELSHSPLELQVGLTAFRQVCARYLCTAAAASGDTARHELVCRLIRETEPDVQVSVLTWMTKQQDASMDTALVGALSRTLQTDLVHVLHQERDSEFLKRFLQAYVYLHQQPCLRERGNSLESHQEALECANLLLSMVEAGAAGPDLLGQELCVASLLLLPGSNLRDPTLLERWCRALTTCSDPMSSEVLRLAAAKALGLAGANVVQRALTTAHAPLQSLAVKVIGLGLQLLQDEDQAVRQEAEGFASLVWSSVQVQTVVIKVQSNKGLVCLLELLLHHFWSCNETFHTLLQHLHSAELEETFHELQANRTASLYEQDEPNVYSEPAAFSHLLLPYLLRLMGKMVSSAPHCCRIACWVRESESQILSGLEFCQQWWSQDAAVGPCFIKVLGSPKVHTALAALLAKAELLVHALVALNDAKAMSGAYTSQEIARKLDTVQGLLAQNGMTSRYKVNVMDRPAHLLGRAPTDK